MTQNLDYVVYDDFKGKYMFVYSFKWYLVRK